MRALILAFVALAASTAIAGAAGARAPRSYLLIALPSLGSVTWRCNTAGDGWALGYREFWMSATTDVALHARGRVVARRRVNPHELVGFPMLAAPRQRLTFAQATEPGTLRAEVRVDFRSGRRGYANCAPYMPPRVTADVFPRR